MNQNLLQPNLYDAVIVLGMNIRKTADGTYAPTTYQDHDEYGMLAGEMNIIASQLLWEHGVGTTFLFSTGTSQKTRAMFGDPVPTEAEVYSQEFVRRLGDGDKPAILLEKNSVNTYSNLTECIRIINEQGWKRVAVMSARYHIPRIQALWDMATEKHLTQTEATFLTAEDVIEHYQPGVYTQQISAAYASPEGQKRLQSEAQGLDDMRSGKYVITEFQLHKN